ncbi:MAG: hypothetical protein JOZ58_25730 [Acetobacteraceae bacterium]|jgi:hypothetical protein|nr:hypothetical protein [Acetobacteraceae bacterium]MBV8578421.1 hypothetical protein [Acetobacteraceae bacterium]
MLKTKALETPRGRVILMDSITKVTAEDKGAFVIAASHGGASSGEFALEVPLGAVIFNDAGIGKDNAGIVALGMLEKRGVPAGTISHESARIGDAQDMWDNGVISHVNQPARDRGLAPGQRLQDALRSLLS